MMVYPSSIILWSVVLATQTLLNVRGVTGNESGEKCLSDMWTVLLSEVRSPLILSQLLKQPVAGEASSTREGLLSISQDDLVEFVSTEGNIFEADLDLAADFVTYLDSLGYLECEDERAPGALPLWDLACRSGKFELMVCLLDKAVRRYQRRAEEDGRWEECPTEASMAKRRPSKTQALFHITRGYSFRTRDGLSVFPSPYYFPADHPEYGYIRKYVIRDEPFA